MADRIHTPRLRCGSFFFSRCCSFALLAFLQSVNEDMLVTLAKNTKAVF